MSDARLSTEAALHNQGVALGDTITAGSLIARGELIAPFDLTVPANDAFFVACRTEVRAAPIVRVFIDWLFAALESDPMPELQMSARTIIRSRMSKPEGPGKKAAPESFQPVSSPRARRAERPQKRRIKS